MWQSIGEKIKTAYGIAINLAVTANRFGMATQSHSNVAAIDFGTSFCSLSYSINGGNVEMLPINDNDKTRVPTAILLKRNREDDSILVIDIGGVAQQKHADLPKSEHKEHIYFECFKMQLRNEEV